MVVYCCVKGCNNSKSKKNDPNVYLSFHMFPSNPRLRTKWLRAIGRPDWTPSIHARVCSAHFRAENLKYDGARNRISDDAFPVYALPSSSSSNVEMSPVEVCRVCLATDVKMYSLKHGMLSECIERVVGLSEYFITEDLPEYACYDCAAHVIKFYNLIKKSAASKDILFDMLTQNGHIIKSLVKQVDREQLKLKSSLTAHERTPTYFYDLIFDDEQNISTVTNIKYIFNDIKSLIPKEEDGNITELSNNCEDIVIENMKVEVDENDYKKSCSDSDVSKLNDDDVFLKNGDESDLDDMDESDTEPLIVKSKKGKKLLEIVNDCNEERVKEVKKRMRRTSVLVDGLTPNEAIVKEHFNIVKISSVNTVKEVKKRKRRTPVLVDGLTPNEATMKEHFNIVKITSLEQQTEEWKKMIDSTMDSSAKVKCEVCSKRFSHIAAYRTHVTLHDPSRGDAQCPVCKIWYRTENKMRSHVAHIHGRKFHCKLCHKVYCSVSAAKNHQLRHLGKCLKCDRCPFTALYMSTLSSHVQREHEHNFACDVCGRSCVSLHSLQQHRAIAHRGQAIPEDGEEVRCEPCNLSFRSENAKRVHLLTAKQHRDSSKASLGHTCRFCGAGFSARRELLAHLTQEHRVHPRAEHDDFPRDCEHCGEAVLTRREHWWHIRRRHPEQMAAYQPLVAAVCDTCGKGFQSVTHLRLHELRHGSPSLRCDSCGRMFFDKFALARHEASAHSDARPYACAACPRAFKVKGNLARHVLIHTGETPHECTLCGRKFRQRQSLTLHVRTVHHKLPHPPRKKRKTRTARDVTVP